MVNAYNSFSDYVVFLHRVIFCVFLEKFILLVLLSFARHHSAILSKYTARSNSMHIKEKADRILSYPAKWNQSLAMFPLSILNLCPTVSLKLRLRMNV